MIAKDLKELSGCDNMSGILILFKWFQYIYAIFIMYSLYICKNKHIFD